jgi:large subunit ribosomal protein L9
LRATTWCRRARPRWQRPKTWRNSRRSARSWKKKAAAEALATAESRRQAIEALGVVEITARVGSEGKLFGSIGVGDVCDAIEAMGGDVQKSEVRMPEGALRVTGEHIVDIHLYTDVDTQVTVNIIGEE